MVALVVLNYNDWETTMRFVESIREYRNIDRIIVVDNHSTDDSYFQLSRLRSYNIDVIQTEENRGYATGNNVGIRYALEHYAPEYVIVSNPDVFFEEQTVDVLREKAVQIDNIGMISCRMKCTSGVKMNIAWKKPTYVGCIIGNFPILNKLIGSKLVYSEADLTEEVAEVDVLPGAFFMMSTEAYRDIDGFDERTFLYYEESIATARLHEKGYKNYLVTSEEYLHMHSVSINKSFSSVKKRLCMCQESREIYCREYLQIGPARMLLLRTTFYFGLYEYLLLSRVRRMLLRR